MAEADTEGAREAYEALQLRVVARVKELYYDLSLIYRNLDLVAERTSLFARIEEAALSRYASGTASQADAVMAQTEKYMLREREAMLKQKIQSLEAMLSLTLGRESTASFARPAPVPVEPYDPDEAELIQKAYAQSPEIRNREKMIAAAEARVNMLKREYYPDFTLTGEPCAASRAISGTCGAFRPPSISPSSTRRSRSRPSGRPRPHWKGRSTNWRPPGS